MRRYPPKAQQAVSKYREFHRLDPRQVGEFPSSFVIPGKVYRAGNALWVTYRSGKVDPETLQRPRRPVSYIHEHDAGVITHLVRPYEDSDVVEVPQEFRDVEALTRLGHCLGFSFLDASGKKVETEGCDPLPDLYTTPDGRCLIVIQSRRQVLAMMWGGGLGVFARGIDG